MNNLLTIAGSQGHQGSVQINSPGVSPHLSSLSSYLIGKTIGEGNFGKVRIAIHKQTNEQVAIKVIEKQRLMELKEIERVYREIHILKILRHPNIIHLYEIVETQKHLFLIMELAEGGELFNYIVKNKRLSEPQACRFFQQIINAIEYLHKQKIVHRDLKPENLLLDKYNNIKVVDFGLSNIYNKEEQLKTACGSPCYAAPEMIAGFKYSGLKVDLWSCGVILYAMLCGYLPFEDNDTNGLYKKILSADYTIPNHVSPEAKDLLKNILNIDPSKRYTISDIRCHVWFSISPHKRNLKSEGLIFGIHRIPIDYEILNEMKKMGFDQNLVIKCLDANQCNSITTTYYLLLKKNYYVRGNSSRMNRNFNGEKIPLISTNKRPKTKSPIGDLSIIEAFRGLEIIMKTEGDTSEASRKHKKSKSFFHPKSHPSPQHNVAKEILCTEPVENYKYVTKLDIKSKISSNNNTPIKIPYINTFMQKNNDKNNNQKQIKEFIDSHMKKIEKFNAMVKKKDVLNGIKEKKFYFRTAVKPKLKDNDLFNNNHNKSMNK